jgi:hypothetical protein
MYLPSSTSILKAWLALPAVTINLYTAANPMLPPQFNMINDGNHPPPIPAPEPNSLQAHAAANQLAKDGPHPTSDIRYGQCYYFTDPKDEHLGSDGGVYSYLKFGSKNYRRPFRLCQERDHCSGGGQIKHRGKFYLQDFQGSSWAKGKNTVAGNEYGYMYPSFGGYTNYLRFQAFRDCDVPFAPGGDCYVRLHLVDEKNNYNGLEINSLQYPYLSLNGQQTISVKFNEVECPDDDDRYEL